MLPKSVATGFIYFPQPAATTVAFNIFQAHGTFLSSAGQHANGFATLKFKPCAMSHAG